MVTLTERLTTEGTEKKAYHENTNKIGKKGTKKQKIVNSDLKRLEEKSL